MIEFVRNYILSWVSSFWSAWDRFWFEPREPHTLAVMRICCGAMLTYVHVIWAYLANDFMGQHAWLNRDAILELHKDDFAWSWLWYVDSPSLLLAHQVVAIGASLCMTLGLFTRVSTVIAWWLTLMVCHRMTLALFGLDQIVVMLSTYLMVSNCGSVLSLDAKWFSRSENRFWFPAPRPSVNNSIATRLLQLHLCVIYLFGGLSKMRGEMWYDGSAMWYTLVNYEYQSLDMVWLGEWRFAIGTLTAVTIFWETFYCALVWPKLTRPIALAMAFFVHGGIAAALGMVTFGSIMIVANFAFFEPKWLQSILAKGDELAKNK